MLEARHDRASVIIEIIKAVVQKTHRARHRMLARPSCCNTSATDLTSAAASSHGRPQRLWRKAVRPRTGVKHRCSVRDLTKHDVAAAVVGVTTAVMIEKKKGNQLFNLNEDNQIVKVITEIILNIYKIEVKKAK